MGFLAFKSSVAKRVREFVLMTEQDEIPLGHATELFMLDKEYNFELEPVEEQYAHQMFEVIESPVTVVEIEPVVEPVKPVEDETKSTELKVVEHNGQFVVDSRDVAEMVGKRHDNLVRDIKGYMKIISESSKLSSQDFFIPNSYKVEGNNKTYECYLLTRKGCDMVANKMTGAKGVLFTATYVTRFEEMEEQLKSQAPALTPSYLINDKIEQAKMWILEEEQRLSLENKVQEQVVVIEEQESIIEEQSKELEFKQELINGIADTVPEFTKRQLIYQLVTEGFEGNNMKIAERWTALYKKFPRGWLFLERVR